ncbi:hypothetical protein ACVWZU_000380 [Thermostichus sp. MS-CIW-26]
MNHLCCQEAQLGPIEADFSRCVSLLAQEPRTVPVGSVLGGMRFDEVQ